MSDAVHLMSGQTVTWHATTSPGGAERSGEEPRVTGTRVSSGTSNDSTTAPRQERHSMHLPVCSRQTADGAALIAAVGFSVVAGFQLLLTMVVPWA